MPADDFITITGNRQFRFIPTVLSHGWVFLAPFMWDGKTLSLPLSIGRRIYFITLQAGKPAHAVSVTISPRPLAKHREQIESTVRWMLRLDEDLSPLSDVAPKKSPVHKALALGAGRLLRAPTVWEEAARVLCTTNIQWSGTVAMVQGLTDLGRGVFPTPAVIARTPIETLQKKARLGYRAASLQKLARFIENGPGIEAWKISLPDANSLRAEIQSWHGFGPYATAHLLVQLGIYDALPIDSEVRDYHAHEGLSDSDIRKRYAQYSPYDFLAYKLIRIAKKKNWIGET